MHTDKVSKMVPSEKRIDVYSIKYQIKKDPDMIYAVDWGWQEVRTWTCSDTPNYSSIDWQVVSGFPEHAYHALYEHFGLDEDDIDKGSICWLTPGQLVARRREKEARLGLPHKEICNHRMGANRDHQGKEIEVDADIYA